MIALDRLTRVLMKMKNFFIEGAMSTPLLYYRGLLWRKITGSSVLDVGCGDGFPIIGFRGWRSNSRVAPYMVGVDAYLKCLYRCRSKRLYDDYILCDTRSLPIRGKSFDTVLCLNLIEHLEKADGVRLLEEAERIAYRRVILYMPVGYLRQPHQDENVYLEHKSGWLPRELEERGYKVRGFSGLIQFRSRRLRYLLSKYPLQNIHYFLIFLSQPVVYFIPRMAFEMFCQKDIPTAVRKSSD